MKRIIAILIVSLMVLSCVMSSVLAVEYKKGDANGDGKLNISDVSAMLKYIAKWELKDKIMEAMKLNGDVNEDGKINLSDATKLFAFVAWSPRPVPAP